MVDCPQAEIMSAANNPEARLEHGEILGVAGLVVLGGYGMVWNGMDIIGYLNSDIVRVYSDSKLGQLFHDGSCSLHPLS